MHRVFASLGPLTQSAIALITVIALWLHLRWTRKSTALGPTLLTTLGIFFCFLGIAWGLLDFDPADVKGSVPHLLQGIRTSFWASVWGIGCALTIKTRVIIAGDPALPAQGRATGATIDDLANHLNRLNRVVAGDEASTLLSQIKSQRTDSNDRLDRLNASLDRYVQDMAEANAKALIQALSEVMRDFNARLNEQFGENFKQLNAAVEKLVTWQAQYRTQLEFLIEQEAATRESMTEASSRYSELVSKATVFTLVAESLEGLLTALNTQSEQLKTSLSSLAELVTKAAVAVPTLERRILK